MGNLNVDFEFRCSSASVLHWINGGYFLRACGHMKLCQTCFYPVKTEESTSLRIQEHSKGYSCSSLRNAMKRCARRKRSRRRSHGAR